MQLRHAILHPHSHMQCRVHHMEHKTPLQSHSRLLQCNPTTNDRIKWLKLPHGTVQSRETGAPPGSLSQRHCGSCAHAGSATQRRPWQWQLQWRRWLSGQWPMQGGRWAPAPCVRRRWGLCLGGQCCGCSAGEQLGAERVVQVQVLSCCYSTPCCPYAT